MGERDRSDYGKRLLAAREHAKLRQVDLAKKAGISQGTLADLENRGHASKFTTQLALACGVRPQWLASGEGAMVQASEWPFPRIALARVLRLNPEDLAYLEGRLETALETLEKPENTTPHSSVMQHTDSSVAGKKKVRGRFNSQQIGTDPGLGKSHEVGKHGAIPAKRSNRRA